MAGAQTEGITMFRRLLLTGVLGPGSNAHGPNEFLDIATGKRVTIAVAHVLDAHARRSDPRSDKRFSTQ